MDENTMKSGSDVLFRFTARESDGTIIPLVDVELVWMLSRSFTSEPILTKNSLDSEIQIVDPANGKFSVELTSEETALLNGQYVHEAKLISWPRVWSVFSGDLEFTKSLPVPQELLDRIAELAATP